MSDITGRPARLNDYAPKKNGQPPQLVTVAVPLPEAHQQDFEATLRDIYGLRARCEAQEKKIAELTTEIAAFKAANMMMESNVTASESRVICYQIERDRAVAERAKWEALFVSIQAQLEAFIPPTLPIVKEAAAPFEAERERRRQNRIDRARAGGGVVCRRLRTPRG